MICHVQSGINIKSGGVLGIMQALMLLITISRMFSKPSIWHPYPKLVISLTSISLQNMLARIIFLGDYFLQTTTSSSRGLLWLFTTFCRLQPNQTSFMNYEIQIVRQRTMFVDWIQLKMQIASIILIPLHVISSPPVSERLLLQYWVHNMDA